MSCFDNCTVYYPQDTYHSYMCASKSTYSAQNSEKLLATVDYDHLWSEPQHKYTNTTEMRPSHISKLRSVLAETISNLTKENKLKKGESVELTLEIELMKTGNNTPRNSLVEVTIIQHNKKEEQRNEPACNNILGPLVLKTSSTTASESASQKRRNWFQRVIRSQIDDYSSRKCSATNPVQRIDTKYGTRREPEVMLDYNERISTVTNEQPINPRSNFVKVLSEEFPTDRSCTKGYKKVKPTKKLPKTPPKVRKLETVAPTKKQSLVKKFSDIFLPAKNAHKTEKVKTALTALKNKVDTMNNKIEEGSVKNKRRNRGPVPNLGKLVDNIIGDMINTPNTSSNSSPTLKYQRFFEPVPELKRYRHTALKTPIRRKLARSRSDTCCVHLNNMSSELKMRTSSSLTDCRAHTPFSKVELLKMEYSAGVRRKDKTVNKNLKKSQQKNAKGDTKDQFNSIIFKKVEHKNNETMASNKSTIEWNGQTIHVNKDIKARIEMLIVNELQNLPLKEGMECDVQALPSTDITNNKNAEKVSSFICELDISNKKLRKIGLKKSKKSLGLDIRSPLPKRNVQTIKQLCTTIPKPSKLVERNKNQKMIVARDLPKHTQFCVVDENTNNSKVLQPKLNTTTTTGNSTDVTKKENGSLADQNDIKVTFVNTNNKNWSVESTTFKFASSEILEPANIETNNNTWTVVRFGENNPVYQDEMCSSFVKKIDSNDSTWINLYEEKQTRHLCHKEPLKPLISDNSSGSTVQFSSSTSNEYQSSIEIELDIRDLELILEEAKQKLKPDQVLVTAKCKKDKKKKKSVKFTGKNSPSYTNQLLMSAANKLDKYVKQKL